jgi:hypothetical protein
MKGNSFRMLASQRQFPFIRLVWEERQIERDAKHSLMPLMRSTPPAWIGALRAGEPEWT